MNDIDLKQNDVVYILGKGSVWDDNELRFSLRSIEKNLPHRKVFIVGECPDWVKNVTHISEKDWYGYDVERNAVHKINSAVEDSRISDNFILMNDDFFILKPLTEIPYTYRKTLAEYVDRFPIATTVYVLDGKNTLKLLREEGIQDPLNYAIHYPMIINKEKFKKMIQKFPFHDRKKRCYTYRTMYANFFDLGGIDRPDMKVNTMEVFHEHKDSDVLSTGQNFVLQEVFQDWIKERFPNKSKYE